MEDCELFLRDFREEIQRSLGEFPAKVTINKLTYIAEDGLPFAAQVSDLLERQIFHVSSLVPHLYRFSLFVLWCQHSFYSAMVDCACILIKIDVGI
jgi:hypothetical protein